MTSQSKNKVLLAIFYALLIVGGFWAYNTFIKSEKLILSGVVQAREMKDTSRFGGRVYDVLVNEGDTVKEGQLLVKFDPAEIATKLEQSRATLTQAKAEETLVAGQAGEGELRSAREAVRQAEQALQLARSGGEADISKAKAAVTQAEGNLAQAKNAFDNAPTMLKEGIISQQKFDQIKADYDHAKSQLNAAKATLSQVQQGGRKEQVSIAQSRVASARAQYQKLARALKPNEDIAMASVEQAESQLKGLEKQLDEMEVTAKINGTVSVLGVLPGDLVLPGQPIVSIIDKTQLWADVYVPEKKLYMIQIGQQVPVRASAFKKKVQFVGHVVSINPKSEFVPSGGSNKVEDSVFRVKVELNPKDTEKQVELYPGMGVDVVFQRAGL